MVQNTQIAHVFIVFLPLLIFAKRLPRFALERPVALLMSVAVIAVAGILAFIRLPVELMPDSSPRNITVFIDVRGGMPPEEVERLITMPVEEAMSTVSDLRNLISSSKKDRSVVTLEFDAGTDMDMAALEAREKFLRVRAKLPDEIEKPVIARYEESDAPICIAAFTSDRLTPEAMRRMVDERLKDRLMRTDGVANVEVGGGRERKIVVDLDRDKLAANSLSIMKVAEVLEKNNLNLKSGNVRGSSTLNLGVRTAGALLSIDEIRNLTLRVTPNGGRVRVRDVAEVKDSFLEAESYSRLNARSAVTVYVQKESMANTVHTADGVEKVLARFRDELPEGVEMSTVSNQKEGILSAVRAVRLTLFYGIALVVLILPVFLSKTRFTKTSALSLLLILAANILFSNISGWAFGLSEWPAFLFLILALALAWKRADARVPLVVAVSIPVSVSATLAFMLFEGVTLNVMSLSGLILGIGLLIDNAIVVVENYDRIRSSDPGLPREDAMRKAASEMTAPMIGGTLTTIVVFIPFSMLQKETQILFSGISFAVTTSLFASLFVSLTLVPLLAVRFEPRTIPTEPRGARFVRTKKTRLNYSRIFFRNLKRTKIIYTAAGIAFLLSIFVFTRVLPRDFMGDAEQNEFIIFVELETGIRLDISNRIAASVEKAVRDFEPTQSSIKSVSSKVEGWSSKIYVTLNSRAGRELGPSEAIPLLRKEVSRVLEPFADSYKAFCYISEPMSNREIFVEVFGTNYDRMADLGMEIAGRMGKIQGLSDVKIRYRPGRPELSFHVDPVRASLLGLDTKEIGETVHSQMRGLHATTFYDEARDVETVVRLRPDQRETLAQMKELLIVSPSGMQIPLEQVSDVESVLSPNEIWRKNKSRMIQVSANLEHISLSKAADSVKKAIRGVTFPQEYYADIGGQYEDMEQSSRDFKKALLVTLFLIFMVMACQFESLSHPLVIMFTVPLSGIGAVLLLFLCRAAVTTGVLIGLLMLGGMAVNHGIMLMERYRELKRSSPEKSTEQLLHRAGAQRLRPIFMTTLTTALGLLPMALDRSGSSQLWSPLAITVLGGLIVSTVLTVFIIPYLFLSMKSLRDRLRVFLFSLTENHGLAILPFVCAAMSKRTLR